MYGVSTLLELSSCMSIVDPISIHPMLFVVDSYRGRSIYSPNPHKHPTASGKRFSASSLILCDGSFSCIGGRFDITDTSGIQGTYRYRHEIWVSDMRGWCGENVRNGGTSLENAPNTSGSSMVKRISAGDLLAVLLT